MNGNDILIISLTGGGLLAGNSIVNYIVDQQIGQKLANTQIQQQHPTLSLLANNPYLYGISEIGIAIPTMFSENKVIKDMAIGALIGGGISTLIYIHSLIKTVESLINQIGQTTSSFKKYLPQTNIDIWQVINLKQFILPSLIFVVGLYMYFAYPKYQPIAYGMLIISTTWLEALVLTIAQQINSDIAELAQTAKLLNIKV